MMHRIVIPTILSTMLLATFAAGASAEERMPPGDGPVKTFEGEDRAHAFGEIDEATRRFRDMSRDYDNEMKALVLREVRTRRQFIERSYGKRIEDVDVVQRQRRLEAIAALERFISRYPNHGEHTPDAMVRLAELYFEKAQVDHDVQMASYERDLDLFERGKIPQEPDSPRNDFSESTKLYDEVIRRFRDYRYRDVCYYMKGYTQYQSGLEREARDSWLAG
ncbi:MAG: tetratricopeptide (TPR) repeat protein, partial [Myxococcota bacterium]